MPESDPIRERLEDQIAWYDRKSMRCQRIFKRIKIVEIVAAAIIPFLAALSLKDVPWSPWLTGGLGVIVTVFEGLLQLGQYQQNWIMYRSTCESLKHEKYLYLGKAGPYASAPDPHALLTERVESLVSQEHAKWASAQQQQPKIKEA
jgi:hypothetical protein